MSRIVVEGNWRYANRSSRTTNRNFKRRSAIKDEYILTLYVCITPWRKLDVSWGPWIVESAYDHKKLQRTKGGTSVEPRREEHTSRDPVLLHMFSGNLLALATPFFAHTWPVLLSNWGPPFEQKCLFWPTPYITWNFTYTCFEDVNGDWISNTIRNSKILTKTRRKRLLQLDYFKK